MIAKCPELKMGLLLIYRTSTFEGTTGLRQQVGRDCQDVLVKDLQYKYSGDIGCIFEVGEAQISASGVTCSGRDRECARGLFGGILIGFLIHTDARGLFTFKSVRIADHMVRSFVRVRSA